MITDPKPEGYRIPELIYDEDHTAETAVTIANLDGNSSEKYEIVIDGSCALTGDPYLTSSLGNTWVGALDKVRTSENPTYDDGVSSGRPKLGTGYVAGGATHYLYIETTLITRSGKRRWCISKSRHREPGYIGKSDITCEHDSDTTTNITSVVLNFPGGFTGNVKVYRVLPK